MDDIYNIYNSIGKPVDNELYERTDNYVKCLICERKCILKTNVRSVCGNYENINGRLHHIGYGKLSHVEVRPIEIKPLYHYYPGSLALTYSNYGCNFYCPWCQNDHISFSKIPVQSPYLSPQDLVRLALARNVHGLSASFNEPLTQFQYVIDATIEAKKYGLYSMVVTNMYFTTSSLKKAIESGIDGFSADIKGCPSMSKALVGIDHEVVFRNAKYVLDRGGHVEIVYLVVTNTNDYRECYEWIINKHIDYLGYDTPLHINRYYPAHRWREPPTPVEKLIEIHRYAREMGLKYVYIGNIFNEIYESTKCPKCGKILIYRSRYRVLEFRLTYSCGKYRCPFCGEHILIYGVCHI
ncbi:MAG: radical SAM protein [Desulfurococcaceae archaeon]